MQMPHTPFTARVATTITRDTRKQLEQLRTNLRLKPKRKK